MIRTQIARVARGQFLRNHFYIWLWLAMLAGGASVHAAIQFDVFLGYGGQSTGNDGYAREGTWFPVVVEVANDGPAFTANFELSPSQHQGREERSFAVELPTGTRKRFTVPVFAAAGKYVAWDARLRDEKGSVRAERIGLRLADVAWESYLVGSLSRNAGSAPSFPPIKPNRPELQPRVARMQPEQFPDSVIALEGLSAIYLNSERALELNAPQAGALLAWIRQGGHLILALENEGDLAGAPWLAQLLAVKTSGSTKLDLQTPLLRFMGGNAEVWQSEGSRYMGASPESIPAEYPPAKKKRTVLPPGKASPPAAGLRSAGPNSPYENLRLDAALAGQTTSLVRIEASDGRVLAAGPKAEPVLVQYQRGRGVVTLLAFSPEREPFRSWGNRPWFWARLLEVPDNWFTISDYNVYGGYSLDGLFGALVETKQVQKLPIGVLLGLLVVYLLVIGPLDYFVLKRMNRQMLTWITFPAYVAGFSLLIYLIGFKLRGGVTEFNEIHVVDVMPLGDSSEYRGRSYASLYSPSNERYRLRLQAQQATMRSEYQGMWGGLPDGNRLRLEQHPASVTAEMTVPVWSSQLISADWVQRGSLPITASAHRDGGRVVLNIENLGNRAYASLRVAVDGRLVDLGGLSAKGKSNVIVTPNDGQAISQYASQLSDAAQAVQSRHQAMGRMNEGRLENPAFYSSLASFPSSQKANWTQQRVFVYPYGFDLSEGLQRDQIVILAWDEGFAPVNFERNFKVSRVRQDTLWRLVIPMGGNKG
jgi:hypothetical protein